MYPKLAEVEICQEDTVSKKKTIDPSIKSDLCDSWALSFDLKNGSFDLEMFRKRKRKRRK